MKCYNKTYWLILIVLVRCASVFGATRTFTGPGNFSDPTKWDVVPVANDVIVIKGNCVFDNSASSLSYGSLTIGSGGVVGTLSWPLGGTNTLIVTTVASSQAGSSIDMTNGGVLQLTSTWTITNLSFTPGTGEVIFAGAAQSLPAYSTFYNLTLSGSGAKTFNATVTTISNNLAMTGTATTSSFVVTSVSGNINLSGSSNTLTTGANISVGGNINIGNGCTLTTGNFTLGCTNTITVDGTLNPNAGTIISANSLTGSGTVKVTRTTATADFLTQYVLSSYTLTNLTVDYSGASAQSVSNITYGNLTISTANNKTLLGDVIVNGLYTRSNGTLIIGAYTLTLNGGISGTTGMTAGASSNIIIGADATLPTTVTALNNLTLNNSSTTTLAAALTISGVLTLNNGILITTVTNLLSITNTSTSAIAGTFSATNGINGPLKWTLLNNVSIDGTNYEFPITDGSEYHGFKLLNVRTGATTPVMQVTYASTGASTYSGSNMSYISPENWRLQTISGNFTSSTISLYDSDLISTSNIGFSAALAGSYTYAGANNIGSSITSTSGKIAGYYALGIDAIATKLIFSYAPIVAKTTTGFNVTIRAVDNNGLLDNDNTASITLSKYSGTGTFSSVSGLTQNLVAGTKTWTDVQYDVAESSIIQASASGLTMDTATIVFTTSNVYYVNDGSTTGDVYTTAIGNDANAGTASAPKLTLNAAYALAAANDYIYVDAGTYSGAGNRELLFTTVGIKVVGAPFISGTGFPTKFVRTGTDRNFLRIQGNNITLSNLDISLFENITASYGSALDISGVTGITINNVQMHDNGASSGEKTVKIYANTTVTFNGGGTTCNKASGGTSGGFYITGNSANVTFNDYIFFNNNNDNGADHGSAIEIQSGTTQSIVIRESRFVDNVNRVGAAAIYSNSTGANIKVINTVFDNNDGSGTSEIIYGQCVEMAAGAARFSNCIFKNSSGSNSTKNGTVATTSASVTLTLDTCYFTNNSMSNGNDLYLNGGTISCTNTTFSSGATNIVRNAGTVTLVKCTNGSTPTKSGTITDDGVAITTSSTANPNVNFTGSCASSVVLPTELLSFSLKCNNGTQIIWQTASETNSEKFIVYHSLDGEFFNSIAEVKGAGNSNDIKQYQYLHKNAKLGINYYKLRQVNFDGNYTDSKIVVFDERCANLNFNAENIFYNSNNNTISVSINSLENEKVYFIILDISGRILFQNLFSIYKGLDNYLFPIPELSSGAYIINLTDNGGCKYSHKILINK